MKRLPVLVWVTALLSAVASPLAAAPFGLPDITLPGLPSPAELTRLLAPRLEAPAPIPEPASVLLVGAALLSLALFRRRK